MDAITWLKVTHKNNSLVRMLNENYRRAFPPENAKCDCLKADSHVTSGVFAQLAQIGS